jgi:hypothetical protein
MEKQINVTKVSVSQGMFLKVSYKELLPDSDERSHPNVSCSAPVHVDLATAFVNIKPHLALICEEITQNEFIEAIPEDQRSEDMVVEMGELVNAVKATRGRKQLPLIPDLNATDEEENIMDNFILNSVEFKTVAGIHGIVLTGEKRLSTGKWMGLGPSPLIKENDPEYKFISDLLQLGEILKYEVRLYINEHKYAPAPDPELPFGDGAVIEEEQY